MLHSAVYWWLRSCYSSGNTTVGDAESGYNTPAFIYNLKIQAFCIMDSYRSAGNYAPAIYNENFGVIIGGTLVVKKSYG